MYTTVHHCCVRCDDYFSRNITRKKAEHSLIIYPSWCNNAIEYLTYCTEPIGDIPNKLVSS